MAIDGFATDEPFYISSAGSADEAVINHDGSDFYIQNDTGKTLFNDKVNPHLTLDHSQKFTGIYTGVPAFPLHMVTTGTNAAFILERTDGATGYINATPTGVTLGSVNNFPVRILANSITRVTIDTAGNITAPATYTTTIGGTNTDLYIDSTGLIGPLPSAEIFKTNIQPLVEGDTEWIYDLDVKKCDYLDGTMDIITVMADEAAIIRPKITRSALFEVGGGMVSRADYANINEIIDSIVPGTETGVELQKITIDENGEEVLIPENKTVKAMPVTVNKSDLTYPILAELKRLKDRLDIIEST